MKVTERPLPLSNAPLQYAPENELGVVFLFSRIAKRLQFRIEMIRAAYPDCIAYRYAGDREKLVRIEFEYRSSNFRAHKHGASQCDCIVCWRHDWPDAPPNIEVIELQNYFGVSRKVWIQVAIKSQCRQLDERNVLNWALSKQATRGDLLLMYRASPHCCITDIFRFAGQGLKRARASWRDGDCYAGRIQRVCKLDSPIFLKDLRSHRFLGTASFVRRNMQGQALTASEYWPYLYEMICERNPSARKALVGYAPDRLG
jgi:hypothetical protein